MSEETEPEKTNNKPSPSSQEASLMCARKLLREGILPIEAISARTGLSIMAVRGLKGAQARAQKKLAAAQADSKPQFQIQAEDEPNIDLNGGGVHPPSLNLTSANQAQAETLETIGGEGVLHPSPSPSNFVLRAAMTREEWSKYSKMKTADLVSEIADLKAQNASLQGVAQTRRGNGGGHDSYAENPYAQKILQIAEAKELKELLGLGKNDHEDNELSRRLDRIETKLDNNKQGNELLQVAKALTELSRPKGEGRDPVEYVLAGNQMRSDIEKNVQSQYSTGVQKSRIDLELEAMQQSERLDYKKLEYDERRADKKEQADNKKWEFADKVVKFFGSEHAGAAIEAVGASMADKIRGSRVPMTTVICPHCTGKFRTNPELPHAMCPNCGAMLDKPTEQQPQPQEPSQSEQHEPEPKGPSTEQEPEKLSETKPEEVIKT
jgi:hypothetical protein